MPAVVALAFTFGPGLRGPALHVVPEPDPVVLRVVEPLAFYPDALCLTVEITREEFAKRYPPASSRGHANETR